MKTVEELWAYILTHVNDVAAMSKLAAKIMHNLQHTYTIKKVESPEQYLDADFHHTKHFWLMGSKMYISKIIQKIEHLIGPIVKAQILMAPSDHPELNVSPYLGQNDKQLYQMLIGMGLRAITLECLDVQLAISILSCYNGQP